MLILVSKLKELQSRRLVSKFNEEENRKLDRQIRNLIKELTERLRENEENIKIISFESTKNNTENLMKDNMRLYLIDKLKDTTKQLNINEKEYVQKYKEFVGDESTDYHNNSYSNGIYADKKQATMSNMPVELSQRGEEIDSLVKNIEELSSIFKDLQVLVVHQGSILDRIDYNIDEACKNVQSANKQLREADENLKSSCARNMIFVLIFVIFGEALLLLLKYS